MICKLLLESNINDARHFSPCKIRDSDWLTFPLIIVNFNHFFIQPTPGPDLPKEILRV